MLAPMREGGDPAGQSEPYEVWIPAFAGMSGGEGALIDSLIPGRALSGNIPAVSLEQDE